MHRVNHHQHQHHHHHHHHQYDEVAAIPSMLLPPPMDPHFARSIASQLQQQQQRSGVHPNGKSGYEYAVPVHTLPRLAADDDGASSSAFPCHPPWGGSDRRDSMLFTPAGSSDDEHDGDYGIARTQRPRREELASRAYTPSPASVGGATPMTTPPMNLLARRPAFGSASSLSVTPGAASRRVFTPSLPTSRPSPVSTTMYLDETSRLSDIASTATAVSSEESHPSEGASLVAAFAEALMFLPLEDIESARRATPLLAAAADRVAPTPLGTPDVVFLRYEPQPIRTTLPATKAQKIAMAQGHNVPAMFRWQCLACGTRTAGPRYCRACRTPMAEGACRVFLGQLRKELTAELVVAMLSTLLPEIELLHVESHTGGSDGHGRGCAWVFVGNVEDARRVTTLHKRILVDVDAEGGEGFWFARDWKLAPGVEAMAAARSAAADRPAGLPRLPMVAEAPARSLLLQALTNRATAFG